VCFSKRSKRSVVIVVRERLKNITTKGNPPKYVKKPHSSFILIALQWGSLFLPISSCVLPAHARTPLNRLPLLTAPAPRCLLRVVPRGDHTKSMCTATPFVGNAGELAGLDWQSRVGTHFGCPFRACWAKILTRNTGWRKIATRPCSWACEYLRTKFYARIRTLLVRLGTPGQEWGPVPNPGAQPPPAESCRPPWKCSLRDALTTPRAFGATLKVYLTH